MYKNNEMLEVVTDFGSGKSIIKKGSMVEFVKTIPNENDLGKSMIVVLIDDKMMVTLESNVRVKSWWRRYMAFRSVNNSIMAEDPRLRRYHPNFILRWYFRAYYYIKDNLSFAARAERKEKALLEKLRNKYE